MGNLAWRRSIPAFVCRIATRRGVLDATFARRTRWPARLAGARAMIGLLDRLARPLLYTLDPEDAHRLAIRMLQIVPMPPPAKDDKRLAIRVFGLNFYH